MTAEPSATLLRADLEAGKVTALEVTEACLRRLEAEEPRIQAWAHRDADHARAQAQALDARKRAGKPLGRLFGLPVGVKDIYDTADYPDRERLGAATAAGDRSTTPGWWAGFGPRVR